MRGRSRSAGWRLPMTAVLLGVAVLIGATMQRMGGVGFALVAAPFLVLLLGPIQGVALTNVLAVATAVIVVATQLRRVEYRRVLPLLVVAATAVIPGAVLIHLVPVDLLSVVTGGLIVAALTLGFAVARFPVVPFASALIVGGGLSGFMSVVAGSAGPGAVAYAVATRWPHDRFVVSVQFYLMCLGAVSLALRGVVPDLSPGEWAGAVGGLALGIVTGHLLAGRIRPKGVRVTTYVLAYAGALWVIGRGVVNLIA